MGMDLENVAGATYRLKNTSWCKALELAYRYGWKPAGTEAGQWIDPKTGELCLQLSHDPNKWNGAYFTNEGQWMTEEDAANLADALKRALDDIPDFDTCKTCS